MSNYKFRAPGEFEKQDAVAVFWPKVKEPITGYDAFKPYTEVIKELTAVVEVYVNCGTEGTIHTCRECLKEADVDMSKVHISQCPDDTSWARDYGPDVVVDDHGHKRLIAFRFNTYGQAEPDFPMSVRGTNMGPHMGIEMGIRDIVFSDIFTEGGDREHNGQGVMMAISDTEGRKRNPNMPLEEVEAEFKRVYNLEKLIWLPLPTYDDESIFEGPLDIINGKKVYRSASANGHIDEMCRFVSADTILLAEVTEEEAAELNSARITKERLDQCYEILKKETNVDGKPFNIVRMPVPEPIYIDSQPGDWTNSNFGSLFSDEETFMDDGSPMPKGVITIVPALSYCNFLIVNDLVLAQKYWKEGMPEKIKQKDEAALAVLKQVFPDRKVIALDTIALNIRGGGIHCITKNVGAAN